MEKQILTNSSLHTFRTCPRKYELRYENGYVPAQESEALYFGKLMHQGIEVWGNGRDLETALHAIKKIWLLSRDQDEYLLRKVLALMEGYHNQYHSEPYEIVEIEKEFRAPILNPDTARESQSYVAGGVIDSILRDGAGRFILKETKTTSVDIEDPASDYWANLQIDSQISAYFLGAEAMGIEIETCLYDVIRKPGIRPSQVGKQIDPANPKRLETPDEYCERLRSDIVSRPQYYYARREVPRMANDLSDYMFDVWNVAQTLHSYQVKGKFPRYVKSCIGIYGTCPYFGVCTGRTSLEDTNLFRKTEVKHPELKQEVA